LKKKNNQIKLGDALKELMDTYKLNVKMNEVRLYEAWDNVLGPTIAKHTVSKQLIEGRLIIRLDSAALRNELAFSKSKIVNSLNEELGTEMVKEIMFA
jgi:predicted nucleic acid-binding Zn ribbon protein